VSGRAAVFLDRDGTIIEDPGYLADPEGVKLLPGAAQAIGRLNHAGRPVVVVTNQSGIARGLLTRERYLATEQRLDSLLQESGARLDAHYYCPHHPDLTGPCTCRKPGVRLFVRAGEDLGLDLAASWWVGDRIRDVLPAETVGGRGLLVLTGDGVREAATPDARRFRVVPDLGAAVELILTAPLPFPAS
jgi:D-glycero-D-manno-heptose 1,7-bisphosphate phosphatase